MKIDLDLLKVGNSLSYRGHVQKIQLLLKPAECRKMIFDLIDQLKHHHTSIIQSSLMSVHLSVRLSVRLKLKILVTTEPIGLNSSGNILSDIVMVLSYFPGGWDTPTSPKN